MTQQLKLAVLLGGGGNFKRHALSRCFHDLRRWFHWLSWCRSPYLDEFDLDHLESVVDCCLHHLKDNGGDGNSSSGLCTELDPDASD